jgi:hypothetical protein
VSDVVDPENAVPAGGYVNLVEQKNRPRPAAIMEMEKENIY